MKLVRRVLPDSKACKLKVAILLEHIVILFVEIVLDPLPNCESHSILTGLTTPCCNFYCLS